MDKKGKDLVVGAVVGTLLGAVTALLFAPKSGKELRSDIADGAKKVTEKTQHVVGQVTEKSKQLATAIGDKTQVTAEAIGRQTTEIVSKAKDAARHVKIGINSWKEARQSDSLAEASVAATTEEREEK